MAVTMGARAAMQLPAGRSPLPRRTARRASDGRRRSPERQSARPRRQRDGSSAGEAPVHRHVEEMNVEPHDPTRTPEPGRKGDGRARQRFGWRNVAVFAGLLLANYLVVSLLFSPASNPRVEIPYRPTFMAQLRDGNVATITAKGLGIEGTFAKAVRYPDAEATATTKFSTEVP